MKTSLAPMLSVRRGSSAVAFYQSAFGADVLFRVDDDTGAVVAQLAIQGAEFWVADESPEHANYSPESLEGSTARMVLVVSDPDALFDRAVKAGAAIVWPVQEQHGWRVGRVSDPYGHHWEIGKPQ
jgi:PhnB protein